jgi:NADH-quinone oxidoreductase subunit J
MAMSTGLRRQWPGVSTGESLVFWILGPLAVLAGIGMVVSRSAVQSALWLVPGQGLPGRVQCCPNLGPFLGLAQIIV